MIPSEKWSRTRSFTGRTREYALDIYEGADVVKHENSLRKIIAGLYSSIYCDRNPDLLEKRAQRSINSYLSRCIVLVKEKDNPREYVGYGIFPLVSVFPHPSLEGLLQLKREKLVYSSRALKKEYIGEGLGKELLELVTRQIYPETRWLVFVTQNPLSVLSARHVTRCEELYPYGKSSKPGEVAKLKLYSGKVQYMLEQSHYIFHHGHSRAIYIRTGKGLGDLGSLGKNTTYSPDERYKSAYLIYKQMTSPEPDGLDLDLQGGDVSWVTLKLNEDYYLLGTRDTYPPSEGVF